MNKQNRTEALAEIATTGNATIKSRDGFKIVVNDPAGPSIYPGIAIEQCFVDSKELRQAAKFLKALADQLDAQFPA